MDTESLHCFLFPWKRRKTKKIRGKFAWDFVFIIWCKSLAAKETWELSAFRCFFFVYQQEQAVFFCTVYLFLHFFVPCLTSLLMSFLVLLHAKFFYFYVFLFFLHVRNEFLLFVVSLNVNLKYGQRKGIWEIFSGWWRRRFIVVGKKGFGVRVEMLMTLLCYGNGGSFWMTSRWLWNNLGNFYYEFSSLNDENIATN